MIFDAARDDFPAEGCFAGLEPADEGRIECGAERVDVVHEKRAELRTRGEQAGERAVFEEIGDFEPMAHGMEALAGKIIGVISAFADGLRPLRERGADALAHFFFLFVEFLLGCFFPSKNEVAHGGHETQADRTAGRNEYAAIECVGMVGAKIIGDGCVREITRRKHVRDLGAVTRGRVAGFREMDLGETAVLAGKFGERVKGFDHAGALGPTRADASGVGDDGAFAATESGFTSGPQGGRRG